MTEILPADATRPSRYVCRNLPKYPALCAAFDIETGKWANIQDDGSIVRHVDQLYSRHGSKDVIEMQCDQMNIAGGYAVRSEFGGYTAKVVKPRYIVASIPRSIESRFGVFDKNTRSFVHRWRWRWPHAENAQTVCDAMNEKENS